MKGFIYRRAGIVLSAVLIFNSLGLWANASDFEETFVSDDLWSTEQDSESGDGFTLDDEFVYDDPEQDFSDIWIEDPDDADFSEDSFEEEKFPDDVESDNSATEFRDETVIEENNDEYFTVRYESDEYGITDLPVDDNVYKKGDIVMISYMEPSRVGYSFWGWSFTGDSSCVYSGGYTFEITEDVTLYATWSADEYFYEDDDTADKSENPVISAINKYVNALKGRFNPKFKYKGAVKSIQCCAFTDQIWENALGIGRYSTPGNYKIIDSKKKLKKSEIYDFLKANDAQPGDIIWCHDPVSAKKYNITHYMILMGYDKKGITITDGYERNGKGIIWKNNQRVSYTGDHAKYFSGKCYVRIYHVTKNNIKN